jgi:hypothetical protein
MFNDHLMPFLQRYIDKQSLEKKSTEVNDVEDARLLAINSDGKRQTVKISVPSEARISGETVVQLPENFSRSDRDLSDGSMESLKNYKGVGRHIVPFKQYYSTRIARYKSLQVLCHD